MNPIYFIDKNKIRKMLSLIKKMHQELQYFF